jgi:hypothetical protein
MQNDLPILRKHDSTSAAVGVVPTIRGRELRVYAVRTPVRRFISIVAHVQDLEGGVWRPLKAVQVTEDALPWLIELCQAAAAVLPDLPPPPNAPRQEAA